MEFTGISHVALTVRDLAVSEPWYTEVFGFERLEAVDLPGHRLVVLVDPNTDISVNLHVHEGGSADEFDERRTGLDHVSFLVEDRAALEGWAAHLDALGVSRSAVVHEYYGSVLVFRDPDGMQLEFFAPPSAAAPGGDGAA